VLSGKRDFTAFCKPRGVLQGLQNIFPFKVGIINQQFFYRFSRANLGEYSAYGQAHTPNTGLTAHYTGIICYTVKMFKWHIRSPSSLNIANYPSLVEGKTSGISKERLAMKRRRRNNLYSLILLEDFKALLGIDFALLSFF
jgi:hypothetical protein